MHGLGIGHDTIAMQCTNDRGGDTLVMLCTTCVQKHFELYIAVFMSMVWDYRVKITMRWDSNEDCGQIVRAALI